MATTIFFTGGSGFVGQNMIPQLIQAGYHVLALARSEKAAAQVRAVGAIPVLDDLTQLTTTTQKALSTAQIVVHSAAYMDFNYQRDRFYQINVEGTRNLVKMAQQAGLERFIYISAAPLVPGSPIVQLKEADAQAGLPKALYPRTKALAERIVLEANSSSFTTLSLRPPAIWGPNNHHFGEILERVEKGKWAWIGGSHQVLSTVHILNLGAAVLAAIQNGQGGEAYFITDGDRRSMRESFSAIFQAYGKDAGQREIPLGLASFLAQASEFVWKLFRLRSRPPIPPLLIRLMAREFSVSDEKARRELGYRNVVSFEEGLETIVQAHRNKSKLSPSTRYSAR